MLLHSRAAATTAQQCSRHIATGMRGCSSGRLSRINQQCSLPVQTSERVTGFTQENRP